MKKYCLFTLLLLVGPHLFPQIEAVDLTEGTNSSQVTDIVVVFKMHVDIGYTDWAEGVLQKYSNEMLDQTLKSIEVTFTLPRNEQFVWTIPGWPLKYMLENCNEQNRIKLEKAIKNGRIVPHALPVTFQTEASDNESLVRGLSTTSHINSAFGLPEARDAKLTDVPSHSRVLPTILKNAGIDFLHIGCNPGSISPDVPRLYWWQGPDGKRLLTMYWAEYYGSDILPPKDWPHKTWLAMIHTHENIGAPTPDEVASILKTAREKMPGAKVKIGRLSDFYDLLIKENPELPVITGDMPDTWIHGYMSMPKETKISKHLQRETFNTEILNSQMNLWGVVSNSLNPYIEEAFENMILYDEHTFGAAMTHADQHKWTYYDEFKINKSLGNYEYIEGSWNEKANRIRKAEKIIKPLMQSRLKKLASSIKVDGKKIVVYNPLPWPRSGRVEFFAGIYKKNFRVYGLKEEKTGDIIPVFEDYNLLSFDAGTIPSLGYKTYQPVLEPISVQRETHIDTLNNRLENRFFRIQIDRKLGTLLSVFDKKSQRELVDSASDFGFGEYFLERPGQIMIEKYNKDYIKPGSENWAKDEMIRTNVPYQQQKIFKGSCDRINYQDMGNAVRATVLCHLNDDDQQSYLVSYTLYENQPYIEIAWGVHGKTPNPLPEAGWLSIPFAVNKPEYRLYRTGGIVDPQTEFVRRTNSDYYFLNTSMALFDNKGSGVAINCPTSPGVSIDKPGLFQFSGTKQLSTGRVYVNLFNNQWGTNFTEWIEGSFSAKMYLWSYENYDSEKTFVTPSEETRVPLKGVFFEGNPGSQSATKQGISLSQKGILITAFYSIDEGMLLRLWEQAGVGSNCIVTLPSGSPFNKAFPCNLRNKIKSDQGIEITNNSFQFKIRANQPASFILK